MKFTPINMKVCTLAALLAGYSAVGVAQENETDADVLAAQVATAEADAARAAALAEIAADRPGTIAGIVAIWEPEAAAMGFPIDGWKPEFKTGLEALDDQQLLAMQSATSYDDVRAIFQGRDVAISLEGVTGTEDLGSFTSDLVFSPVVPCRIFDTRFGTGSYAGPFGGNPGTVKNYNVQSSVDFTPAQMAAQGGNAAGCPLATLPTGVLEPLGISANFTAVPLAGTGHLRAWPFGSPQPTASFLNYRTAGTNIANSGIIATCYFCGPELSVSTWFGSAHSLADVMGYFFPAVIPDNSIGMAEIDSGNLNKGFESLFSGTLVSGNNYIMASAFVANASGSCVVNASGQVNDDITDNNDFTFFRTARQIGAGSPANDGAYGLYSVAVPGATYSAAVGANAIWSVTAGQTYRFGCYFGAAGDHVGNTAACRVSWVCL